MKKISCLVLVFIWFSLQIHAQSGVLDANFKQEQIDSLGKKNNYRNNKFLVCLYPLTFIGNFLTLGTGYKIFINNAFRPILGYNTVKRSNFYNLDNLNEFYSELQYRIYPNRKPIDNMNGIFFCAYGLTKTRSYKETDFDTSFDFANTSTLQFSNQGSEIKFIVGIQGIFYCVISFDAYMVGGLILPTNSEDNHITNNTINFYKKELNFQKGSSVS